MTDYARAALEAAPGGQFTIVAHSSGGAVASELVRLAPGRVTGLVAAAAVIPAAGASFTSLLAAGLDEPRSYFTSRTGPARSPALSDHRLHHTADQPGRFLKAPLSHSTPGALRIQVIGAVRF